MLLASALAFLVASCAPPAGAAPPAAVQPAQRTTLDAAAAESLQRRIDRTLDAGRYAEAIELIERYLAEVGRDPTMLYNAACCRARMGDGDGAAKTLLDAIRAGFRDFDAMEEDPDLDPIREHPIYTAILEARDRAAIAPAPAPRSEPAPRAGPSPLEEWRARHGDKDYVYESDPERGLHYATSLDEEGRTAVRETLTALADHLATTLFDGHPRFATLVAVPTLRDMRLYFPDPTTTGMYEHAQRRLVARDIGQSLTHEFVHLMHWGHMDRLGQHHPMWVQEGLACLYEDYDLAADGSIAFRPNTRHNIARRQVLAAASMSWRQLFELSPREFMRKPLQYYPQVRSIFEFLADRGRLEPFYRALIATHGDDPTGAMAIERAFGRPLNEVEQAWKDWLRLRGPIDDSIGQGDASLGIRVAEAPDGVRVAETFGRGAARSAGMRSGDVIVAVDGRSVRSSRELLLALAAKHVGDAVEIRFRRGGEYHETTAMLRPLGSRR